MPMAPSPRHWTVVIAVVLLALAGAAHGFTFEVEPYKMVCFFETVEAGAPINVRFQVIKGGFLDIDVQVFNTQMQSVWSGERASENSFSLSADNDGDFQFCFSNRMSTITAKVVSLTILVGKAPNKGPSTALEPLEAETRQILQGVEEVKNGQVYLKNREAASRDTSESTNGRVLWYSIFEAIALIAVCGYQVYSIRSFFEVKRVV